MKTECKVTFSREQGLWGSQKLRKVLDASFSKKGIFFWILSPLLFLVSFVFACVAKFRRQKGYARFSPPDSLHVICIGNILVGGTGKSPLVRAYASHFLKKDSLVAIAARGIGAQPIVVNSHSYTKENLDALSDENREHFEILRSQFPKNQFYIFQNKNRHQSLNEFRSLISQVQNKKCIFILDDGLQHFDCPRHENICVCDAKLHATAPPYAMPVGPYREGFGRGSIEKILSSFDKRIWTHVNSEFTGVISPLTAVPSPDLGVERGERGTQDFSASYKLSFVQFHIFENGDFEFQPIESIFWEDTKKTLLIAGIAHPERFFSDLKNISTQFESCDTYSLADHEQITKHCLKKIEQSEILVLTLKDFFRFCTNKTFITLCSTRKVYSCYPEYFLLG